MDNTIIYLFIKEHMKHVFLKGTEYYLTVSMIYKDKHN